MTLLYLGPVLSTMSRQCIALPRISFRQSERRRDVNLMLQVCVLRTAMDNCWASVEHHCEYERTTSSVLQDQPVLRSVQSLVFCIFSSPSDALAAPRSLHPVCQQMFINLVSRWLQWWHVPFRALRFLGQLAVCCALIKIICAHCQLWFHFLYL